MASTKYKTKDYLEAYELLIQSGTKMVVNVFLLASITLGALVFIAGYLYVGKILFAVTADLMQAFSGAFRKGHKTLLE